MATLKKWISEGAQYEPHWAFVPPHKSETPVTSKPDWVRNPIDAYVLAALDQKNIQPSPEADKETLIRRLHMDLVGLPPSPEQIDTFLNDTSEQAYETLVDRILASPHYGERMAIDWLDVARYADSNAIHVDMMRTSWPWRDWVIKAFNENKPYDEFITEQIAGDLMPDASVDQKVATSFNRHHGITNEGGVIPEEFLVEYSVDRVSTMGSAFLGLTLGCARCHDHKFDPISMDDFYSLMSFFNNIPERGLEVQDAHRAYAYPPFTYVYSDEEKAELSEAEEIIKVQTYLKELTEKDPLPQLNDDHALEWEALRLEKALGPKGKELKLEFSTAKQTGNFSINIAQNPETKEIHHGKQQKTAVTQSKVFAPLSNDINIVRIEAKGAMETHKFKVDLETPKNNMKKIALKLQQEGSTTELEILEAWASAGINGSTIDNALDDDYAKDWQIGLIEREHNLFLRLKEPLKANSGNLVVSWETREPQVDMRAFDRYTVYAGFTTNDLSQPFALIPTKERMEWHHQTLEMDTYFAAGKIDHNSETYLAAKDKKAYINIKAVRCMVMEENPKVEPTYVLNRGLYDQPLKDRPRPRAAPAVFPPLPEGSPTNRLGLAQWLVMKDNPLVARVTVNRLWQLIFGNGIVKTSEDFGLQSDSPTHPKLLDYLAVDFQESGWDVKALMKQIVSSATYRQSSTYRKDLAEIDPDNKLLARAPRFRFPAELVRDNALAASGLLNPQIGGPSVKPYQPDGLWREKAMRSASNTGIFKADAGDKLYRRGLYTFWKQASPPPQMELFDAPSREACTVKRRLTNTPLQALMLMNDKTYLEMSRALASRLMTEVEGSWDAKLNDRIERGLRLTTGRKPTTEEISEWATFTKENLEHFNSDPEGATDFLNQGELEIDPSLSEVELAALTFTMSTAFNLDETITRD